VEPPAVDESTLPEATPEHPPRSPTDAGAPAPFANEPRAELRRPGPRARLRAAVEQVSAELGLSAPVLIEGRAIPTGDELISVDPGRPDVVVCRSGRAGPVEADRAVEAAQKGWRRWRDASWRDRAAVLFRAAALMRQQRA